jgi:putative transposase
MTIHARDRYAGYRFPAEIIGHAVWLYFRFPLGLRMVEELLAARGIIVSHETVILAAVPGGGVGRDAQSPGTSRRGGAVSLSGDNPVPQCCRTRFARLAAPAASEVG